VAGKHVAPSKWEKRLGAALATVLLIGAVGGVTLVALSLSSGRWRVAPIRSGSMRPGLPVGGLVATERVPVSSLAVRDVLLFHPPGEPDVTFVHRIISIDRAGSVTTVRTQGDDNPRPDPWTLRLAGRSAYKARFTVPLIGYVAFWFGSAAARAALVVGVAIVVAALLAWALRDRLVRRRSTGAAPADVVTGPADVVAPGPPAEATAFHESGIEAPPGEARRTEDGTAPPERGTTVSISAYRHSVDVSAIPTDLLAMTLEAADPRV